MLFDYSQRIQIYLEFLKSLYSCLENPETIATTLVAEFVIDGHPVIFRKDAPLKETPITLRELDQLNVFDANGYFDSDACKKARIAVYKHKLLALDSIYTVPLNSRDNLVMCAAVHQAEQHVFTKYAPRFPAPLARQAFFAETIKVCAELKLYKPQLQHQYEVSPHLIVAILELIQSKETLLLTRKSEAQGSLNAAVFQHVEIFFKNIRYLFSLIDARVNKEAEVAGLFDRLFTQLRGLWVYHENESLFANFRQQLQLKVAALKEIPDYSFMESTADQPTLLQVQVTKLFIDIDTNNARKKAESDAETNQKLAIAREKKSQLDLERAKLNSQALPEKESKQEELVSKSPVKEMFTPEKRSPVREGKVVNEVSEENLLPLREHNAKHQQLIEPVAFDVDFKKPIKLIVISIGDTEKEFLERDSAAKSKFAKILSDIQSSAVAKIVLLSLRNTSLITVEAGPKKLKTKNTTLWLPNVTFKSTPTSYLPSLSTAIEKEAKVKIDRKFTLEFSQVRENLDVAATDSASERFVLGANYLLDEIRLNIKEKTEITISESETLFITDSKDCYDVAREFTNYLVMYFPYKALEEPSLGFIENIYLDRMMRGLVALKKNVIAEPPQVKYEIAKKVHTNLSDSLQKLQEVILISSEQQANNILQLENLLQLNAAYQDVFGSSHLEYKFLETIVSIESFTKDFQKKLLQFKDTVYTALLLSENGKAEKLPEYFFDATPKEKNEYESGKAVYQIILANELGLITATLFAKYQNYLAARLASTQSKKKLATGKYQSKLEVIETAAKDNSLIPAPTSIWDFLPTLQQEVTYFDANLLVLKNVVREYQQVQLLKSIVNELITHLPKALLETRWQGKSITGFCESAEETLAKINSYLDKIECSPVYIKQIEAMFFLNDAREFFLRPDVTWPHQPIWAKTYYVPGTNKKCPAYVREQINEIEAAEKDGDYVHHLAVFHRIQVSGASANAREYLSTYRLFSPQLKEQQIANVIDEAINADKKFQK